MVKQLQFIGSKEPTRPIMDNEKYKIPDLKIPSIISKTNEKRQLLINAITGRLKLKETRKSPFKTRRSNKKQGLSRNKSTGLVWEAEIYAKTVK